MAEATTSVRGTSILEQLGLNTADVLGADNVASTLTNPEAPVNDALGIFAAQEEAAGVGGLKETFQTAQSNFLNAQNLANQEQLTIQGRAKKLGVLRGEQQQAATQANIDLQTLQTAQQLAGSALQSAQATALQKGNILYNEYQQKVNLQLQFPGLKINPLKDDFSKVSKKIKEYEKEQKKDAEKDAYKSALRDLGLSTSGSRKELEKRLEKANKNALAEAKKNADLDYQIKSTQLAKAKKDLAGGGGGGLSNTEIEIANTNSIAKAFSSLPKGDDEYTNPNDWRNLESQWTNAGGSVMDFHNKFQGFINPDDSPFL